VPITAKPPLNLKYIAAVMNEVLQERLNHVEHGHTPEQDSRLLTRHELAMAAALLLAPEQLYACERNHDTGAYVFKEPWPLSWDPREREGPDVVTFDDLGYDVIRERLIQGIALALAEIERIDRLNEEVEDVIENNEIREGGMKEAVNGAAANGADTNTSSSLTPKGVSDEDRRGPGGWRE
jgi:hypothetical protein